MPGRSRMAAAAWWRPDDTARETYHRLEGLEPDNLLAFMALLGLLRALELARPEWQPRARWEPESYPWHPSLVLAKPASQLEIAEAASLGAAKLSDGHHATGEANDLRWTLADLQALRARSNVDMHGIIDALATDCGVQGDDQQVLVTPFCFMFGQGHQHFLKRLRQIPKICEQPDTAMLKVASSLFRPWERAPGAEGFRWDPAEDRRYALRARDPRKEKTTAEAGANILATLALPICSVIAVRHRSAWHALTPATRFAVDGAIEFTWPLWSQPSRLAGIRGLLAHPELAKEEPRPGYVPGVFAIWRARRISVGRYLNVTPAKRLA